MPTYQVKACFATSNRTVVKIAPFNELTNLTFFFGSITYIIVTVNRTSRNETANLMKISEDFPIEIAGIVVLRDFKNGIIDAAANEVISNAMIKVTTASEMRIEKKKFRFCLTLKTAFRAFSSDANT